MQEVDKAGYETLRSNYPLLTSAIDPNDLLPHFFAKKLISPGQKQEIDCATKEHGRSKGCEKLLDTLLSNGKEGAFWTFLEILRDHPHLQYLESRLQQEYDKHHQDLFQEQARRQQNTRDPMDSANLDEKRVDEMIHEKMKDLQILREKIYPHSVEEVKFLEILQKLGELKKVSHLVASCEVLVAEQCVKLVGTPEETRQAKREIDHILEHAVRKTESLPEFVSSQIVGQHAAKCMEMNEGVLVLPEERKMKFIAKSAESCKKAKEWLQAHAYPAALEFTGKEIFGRYVYTSSRLPGRTPVRVKAVPEAFCAEYLHPLYHDPRQPLYFTMELPKRTAAVTPMSFKRNLSWCTGSIRQKLKSVFVKVQPYRANLKVGYEARFGHAFWKLGDPGAGPGYEAAAGKQWTLDQFTHPHSLHSRFFVRVDPNIQELLSKYTDDLHLLVKLLDPLKLKVTRRDGTKVDCVAVIEELRDGRFILNNVYYAWNARGKPRFDIVLPEKKYDVRIAPCFDSVVEQYCDAEVREIVDHFRSTIHRRRDGTLLMKVRGPNYQVRFMRQKVQTQHRWRASKKWILAVYHVHEFEILDGEIEKWPLDEEVTLPLKKPKTEIELWNQKIFGDFASHANFSKSEYEAVKSIRHMWLPGEDIPRKGSLWTAEEMMQDFEDFVATAVHIAELLTESLSASDDLLHVKDMEEGGPPLAEETTASGDDLLCAKDMEEGGTPLAEEDNHLLSICEQVMREFGKLDQTIMHCIFVGPPGVGKSSLLKRLLRMKLDPTRTSTPVVEKSVRVEIRNVATHVAQVSGFDWQITEDPMTQASGLIEQLSMEKVPTEENRMAMDDLDRQVSRQTDKIPNQRKKLSNLPAEELDNRTITTSTVEETNESQVTTSPAQELNDSNSHVEESECTVSTNQDSGTTQFGMAIDFFRQVLKERGISKVHIDNLCTLYLTDSGGQPQFQELLPALAAGPSVFFIVFPLHKALNSKYDVEYVRDGKNMHKYTSSFTIKEDLMRSLASIASTEYKDIYGNKVQPRMMFVATFKDKVPNEEDRQRRLKELQDIIEETDAFHQGMIVEASETQMAFTINNASDDESEKDAKEIRDAFQVIANADDFKVRTPSPWLIFGILVQHVHAKDNVISKQDCFELAQECGIKKENEFEAALQFLHKQTGVLHYYVGLPELSQIVIRDPQHLFSRVSQLVEKTFTFEETRSRKCITEFKRGLFCGADYETLTKESNSSKLTPSMLLNLLEYLHVVVPLGDGEKYFMPCAIAHLDEDTHFTQLAILDVANSHHLTQSPTIPPLLITFDHGYCPKGLFGALVACIVNKQVANCTLSLDPSKIYRDTIGFKMGQHELFLRINPTYIYIEIKRSQSCLSTDICTLRTLCNHVRKLIEDNIKEACKTLHYSSSYKLSFVCQCCQEETIHPAELREDPVEGHYFRCTQSKEESKTLVNLECHVWLPEPTIIKMVPEKQSVALGTEAIFSVKATGDGQLEFQWRNHSGDLCDDSRYHGTKTDTLRIVKVEKCDQLPFQCLVKNDIKETLSNKAVLTVVDPPKITQHPESRSVATGEPTFFTVEATGDDLQFQWQKDGKNIDSWLQVSQTDKSSTLHIQCVKKSDRGYYKCLVRNQVAESGKPSHVAELTVTDPPKITRHPENGSVATGKPTFFTVEATGDDLQFQWQKDDKDIDRNMPWLQVSQTDKSSTLRIQCVKKSDRGYYKCLVRNQVAESGKPSHMAELTVTDLPKITRHPENGSVATGKPTFFTVEATGDDLQFQWQKDDKDIDRNMPWLQVSQTDKSSTLRIQCVKKSDRGYYRCLVRNQVAESGKPSHVAELTVTDPPIITQHPESRSVATGEPTFFTVEATGDDLQFQWQKDGKHIDRNMPWLQVSQTDKSSTLHIQRVKKSDRGYYKCLVRNQVAESGKPSHVAELTVNHNWKQFLKRGGIICLLVLVFVGIWWLQANQSIVSYPLDHVGFSFKLDHSPTLPALRHFPVDVAVFIDIAIEIGPDYEKFGTLLLEDKNGVKVKSIKMSKRDDPVDITVEILQQWLQGKGRMPVTWQTLVKCLRDIDLNVLADKIDHSLSKQEL